MIDIAEVNGRWHVHSKFLYSSFASEELAESYVEGFRDGYDAAIRLLQQHKTYAEYE